MGTELPRIAVVIPNWNCEADLRNCIASLRSQEGVELEIMVVDNGSSDGSLEYLNKAGIPHISLPRNLGFAPAVNLGFKDTSAPAVATLNADTVLEPGALLAMHRVLASDGEIGGVQPRILSLVRGTTQDPEDPAVLIYSLGQALTVDGRAYETGLGESQGGRSIEAREIFGVCGAACLFRRQMLDQLGGFDDSYFAFYEDVDLNVRGRVTGWSFRLVPEAVIWHVGNAAWHAGFDRPDAENASLVARNRIRTQFKFMPVRRIPRVLAVEAGALARAARARRLRLTLAGKVAAFTGLPGMIRSRRELRRKGDLSRAQVWLGKEPE